MIIPTMNRRPTIKNIYFLLINFDLDDGIFIYIKKNIKQKKFIIINDYLFTFFYNHCCINFLYN